MVKVVLGGQIFLGNFVRGGGGTLFSGEQYNLRSLPQLRSSERVMRESGHAQTRLTFGNNLELQNIHCLTLNKK